MPIILLRSNLLSLHPIKELTRLVLKAFHLLDRLLLWVPFVLINLQAFLVLLPISLLTSFLLEVVENPSQIKQELMPFKHHNQVQYCFQPVPLESLVFDLLIILLPFYHRLLFWNHIFQVPPLKAFPDHHSFSHLSFHLLILVQAQNFYSRPI